jgi:hypothetical protein
MLTHLKYMLSWVTLAYRPLSIQTLGQALVIRTAKHQGLLSFPRQIRYLYGSVFAITTRKGAVPSLEGGLEKLDSITEPPVIQAVNDRPKDLKARMCGRTLHPRWKCGLCKDQCADLEENTNLFITIRHAYIRDFFLYRAKNLCPNISVDESASRVSILKTCLQVFCDDWKYERCQSGLARHASHFHKYFQKIEVSQLGNQERYEIAELLIQIFRDEKIVARWVNYSRGFIRREMLYSSRFVETVRYWLKDSQVATHFQGSQEIEHWICEVLSSPWENLFQTVAEECGRRWLKGEQAQFEFEVLFIHSYREKVGDTSSTFDCLDGMSILRITSPLQRTDNLTIYSILLARRWFFTGRLSFYICFEYR